MLNSGTSPRIQQVTLTPVEVLPRREEMERPRSFHNPRSVTGILA
jgi:hypothetical protein